MVGDAVAAAWQPTSTKLKIMMLVANVSKIGRFTFLLLRKFSTWNESLVSRQSVP